MNVGVLKVGGADVAAGADVRRRAGRVAIDRDKAIDRTVVTSAVVRRWGVLGGPIVLVRPEGPGREGWAGTGVGRPTLERVVRHFWFLVAPIR